MHSEDTPVTPLLAPMMFHVDVNRTYFTRIRSNFRLLCVAQSNKQQTPTILGSCLVTFTSTLKSHHKISHSNEPSQNISNLNLVFHLWPLTTHLRLKRPLHQFMNHFNEGAGSTETTMQRLNVTHSESGFVSLDGLIPPRPDNQPCPCCFALDAPTAIRSDGNQITWNRRESVICLRRSMRDIEVSTISGCQICSVLFEILIFFGLDPRDDGSVRNIELRIPTDLGNLGISFYNSWTELYVQVYMCMCIQHLEFYYNSLTQTTAPHERTWNRIRPLPDICAHQLSDEGLSFVRSCLQTCLNKHTLRQQSEGGLPARLLDVGHCGDSAIRLVETKSAASVKYIALSYCWGDNVTVKTTLAGLENMKSGISISELLQAYVDAVALTRELGIQYLWIDALCIIQDSHEDWVKESAKMSGIYAKAYLTIAAASSGSANQPFLHHSLRTG